MLADYNHFEHITPHDGLSDYSITAFCQDRFGRMWIGTYDGVNCYDGHSFHSWTGTKEGERIVKSIDTDMKDKLLLRFSGTAAIFHLDSEELEPLPYQSVNATAIHNAHFYIAAADTLFLDDNYLLSAPDISALTWRNDTLWLAFRDGVGYVDSNADIHVIAPIHNVSQLYVDSRANIYICTRNHGLYCLSLGQDTPCPINLPHRDVRCIVEDQQGNLWIGMYSGLCQLQRQNEELVYYDYNPRVEHSLSTFSVWALACDRQGTVWIGTFFGGVDLINPLYGTYTFYSTYGREAQILSNPIVTSFAEDTHANLYIGTNGGGVNMLNRHTQAIQHISISAERPQPAVKALAMDTLYHTLWIGTHQEGVKRLNLNTNQLTSYYLDDPNTRQLVLRDSTLYILTRKNVYRLITTPAAQHARPSRVLPDSLIPAISGEFADMAVSHDTLWFAHRRMLYAWPLNDKHPTLHTRLYNANIQVLSYSAITGLQVGLYPIRSLVNLDSLAYTLTVSNRRITLRQYDTTVIGEWSRLRGLPLETFMGRSAAILSSGEIAVGGLNGFVLLDPHIQVKEKELDLSIILSQVTINNKPASLSQALPYVRNIELLPDDKSVSFTLSTNGYLRSLCPPLQYRLRGFDKDWIKTDDASPALSYTNLPAGTYILEVESQWNKAIHYALNIEVLPPWYKRWWMIVIYVLISSFILLALSLLFARTVAQQTRKQMSEQQQQDFQRIMTIVMNHLSDSEFTIDRFAREMGMSRTLLYKHVNQTVGQSPNDFILSVRLRESCKLLCQNPQMSIVEVSERVGFNSGSYFIKCFHRTYGKSPAQWRKSKT